MVLELRATDRVVMSDTTERWTNTVLSFIVNN